MLGGEVEGLATTSAYDIGSLTYPLTAPNRGAVVRGYWQHRCASLGV